MHERLFKDIGRIDMISVSLIWIYMFLTLLPVGFAVLKLLYGILGYKDAEGVIRYISVPKALLAGITAVTFYAECYSLVDGVGGKACILLLAINMVAVLYARKEMYTALKNMFGYLNDLSFVKVSLILFVLLIVVYFTSSGYFIFDTGLYHSQAIHWLENYGVVLGSGNIQYRVGYNSSSMCLFALYSFKWLTGQSFHACNGFIFSAVLIEAIRHLYRKFAKEHIMSTACSIASVLCCLILIYYVISPTSDIMPMVMVLWLVMYWCDLIENDENNPCPYALLSVLGVFIFTGKVSMAMIVLLVIKPAVMLIKEKNVRDIIIYVCLGILMLAPFMIRNVLITGWLLYPFSGIDLFNVDWKISKEFLIADAWNSMAGSRQANYPALMLNKWFPIWWEKINNPEKFWLGAIIVATLLWIKRLVVLVMSKFKADYKWLHMEFAFFAGVVYWFFTGPVLRYASSFIALYPFIIFASIIIGRSEEKKRITAWIENAAIIAGVLLAVCGVPPHGDSFKYTEEYRSTHVNVVRQQDYYSVETEGVDIGGITIYYPVEGNQVWYESFPGAPNKNTAYNVEMRGDSIKDGFRAINP